MGLDTANSLITLAEAKAWLSILTADTDFDAAIENMIDGVSWNFNNYTNRLLKSRTITEYQDGGGHYKLLLRQYPVTSLTSVNDDPNRAYGVGTAITLTDLVLYGDEGALVYPDGAFSDYPQSIKIVYLGGYTTIPYDLQVACKDQVKFNFQRWRDNMEGVSSKSFDAGSVTVEVVPDILPSVKKILEKYRRVDHG